jgi:hypothetical protein
MKPEVRSIFFIFVSVFTIAAMFFGWQSGPEFFMVKSGEFSTTVARIGGSCWALLLVVIISAIIEEELFESNKHHCGGTGKESMFDFMTDKQTFI